VFPWWRYRKPLIVNRESLHQGGLSEYHWWQPEEFYVAQGEFEMKKWLGSSFIALCFLISFTCQLVSAGAFPFPHLETFTQNANFQTSQETTTTNQEKKAAVNLQDYVGRFEADPKMVENFIFDVFLEKDELWIKPSHEVKRQLLAKMPDSFVITVMEIPVKFNRDAKGLVESLTLAAAPTSNAPPMTAKKLVLPPPSLKGNTTFRLKGHRNARVVAVAGSFNDWNQSQRLCGKEGDEWVCRIDLAPGKYTYKFIIDGDWILDPENPNTEDDERGFTNSVLVVK
jgi:AMP-activated protein kinase-like protein